ncbi:MAG: hypothetical protein O2897_00825, partial [bacterium]|nr:hypothetical protein [bacterium]
ITELAKEITYLEGARNTAQAGNSSRDETIKEKDGDIAEQQGEISQLSDQAKELTRQVAAIKKELATARSTTDTEAAEEIAQENVALVTQKNRLSQQVVNLQNQLSTQEKGLDAQIEQAVSHKLEVIIGGLDFPQNIKDLMLEKVEAAQETQG